MNMTAVYSVWGFFVTLIFIGKCQDSTRLLEQKYKEECARTEKLMAEYRAGRAQRHAENVENAKQLEKTARVCFEREMARIKALPINGAADELARRGLVKRAEYKRACALAHAAHLRRAASPAVFLACTL